MFIAVSVLFRVGSAKKKPRGQRCGTNSKREPMSYMHNSVKTTQKDARAHLRDEIARHSRQVLPRDRRPQVGVVAHDALLRALLVVVEEGRLADEELVGEHAEAPDVDVLYKRRRVST